MTKGRLNLRKLCNFCIVWIILNIGILIELCSEEWKESLVHRLYDEYAKHPIRTVSMVSCID